MKNVKEDLTGKKFNHLTVIKRVEDKITSSGYVKDMWLTQCDCGLNTGWWDRELDCSVDKPLEYFESLDDDQLYDIIHEENNYGVPECLCPICNFIEYSQKDLAAYLLKEYNIPRDVVFEEVKKINKRRKKLYDSEYIQYVCRKHDLNPTEIVAEWKEKFGKYYYFKKFITGKE